jgi:thiamine biosynthesis protein ThiS
MEKKLDQSEQNLIEVTINGEKRKVPAGLTVDGLLGYLGVKKASAIVEHNRVVLKQRDNTSVNVNECDVMEIVRFVGGG